MKKDILIIKLVVIVLGLGSYLIFDRIMDKKIENETIENNNSKEENKDGVNKEDNSNQSTNETKQLENYDINAIKNIQIAVPVKNAEDPEKKNVTLTDKEEIKSILLNVDNVKEIGALPSGIGFVSNVVITINYDEDPSTTIIILDNGNIAINKAVGVGETGYAEFEIQNKSLATELTNKYQN